MKGVHKDGFSPWMFPDQSSQLRMMFKNKQKTTQRSTSSSSIIVPQGSNNVDANISETEYALRCKELMALHSDLSSLGAGGLLALPRIVVIGGQSAGKSSLVEAISGISVPRDSGTCTRCPMECSLTRSNSTERWSCDVSLRIDYDMNGTRLPASKVESFGPRLTDKFLLDIWLRRAQAAILSPHRPSEYYIHKSREELREAMQSDSRVLKFSKNTVSVALSDPDVTVLSFVDLPGLIQNESVEIIELVKEMVVERISGEMSENTLILITIPMSDDMENQQAVRLAREADPEGKRTIGVLTKPDTLTQGAISAREKWKDVIQGKAHILQHGYYCVRLLDDDERARKISRSDAQKLETQFFQATSPWNVLSQASGRFGVPAFVNDISRLLVDMIEKNLPKLKNDVMRLLRLCQTELDMLPKPVTNEPSTEVLLRVTKFCNDFRSAVYGDDYKQLAQDNRRRYELFKYAIRRTAPDFRPFVGYQNYHRPPFSDDEPDPPTPIVQVNAGPAMEVYEGAVYEETVDAGFNSKPYGLLEIRDVIKRSTSWELPGHVPFDALKTLVLEFTSLWTGPTMECFDDIFKNLSTTIDHYLNIHFNQYKQLHMFISSLVKSEIVECRESALRMLSKLLMTETVPVFTQNTHYLEETGKKWHAKYVDAYRNAARYEIRHPPAPQAFALHVDPTSTQQAAIYALYQAGFGTFTVEELSRLLPPNVYRQEFVLMSQVRAYFQVAYKRFIDYVPLAIEHELNQAVAARLQENIFHTLLKSPQRMNDLLSEEPAIVKQREFLTGRISMLKKIELKLDNFRRETVTV